MRELVADVLIVGAGMGGFPAALAAATLGSSVILSEEADWLGGEVSNQGVPFDDHQYVETVPGSASYANFRQRLRDYYRRNYPMTAASRDDPHLNPGMGFVSGLCVEPRVCHDVMTEMLSPHLASGRIRLLMHHRVVGALMDRDTVKSVRFKDAESGTEVLVAAKVVLDATDLGEVLEAAKVEHVIGAESQDDTGEKHALPGPPNPLDQQAITWVFAIDWSPKTENVIERPGTYDRWRNYRPKFPWPGPLFDYRDGFIGHLQPLISAGEPRPQGLGTGAQVSTTERYRPFLAGAMSDAVVTDWWHYRRCVYSEHFAHGAFSSDVTLMNTVQHSYWELPLLGVDDATRERALREAQELSLSFLYWLQTEAPRHDKGQGYPEVRLRDDVFGTQHGLAKQVYIREGRRILPVFRITESHFSAEDRPETEHYADSVGIGSYRIELHPSTAARAYISLAAHPFEIALGALLPVRVNNLIAAGKTMGTTHIANGAYRLHPTEWSVGVAAGALAAFCEKKKLQPKQVREVAKLLEEFQSILRRNFKVPLRWPVYEARRGPLPHPTPPTPWWKA